MICYLRRVAEAKVVDYALLIRHLGDDWQPSMTPMANQAATPQILDAVRRAAILRRRRRDLIDKALSTAVSIISDWHPRPGRLAEPDPIEARWKARARFLPGVPDRIIRYPKPSPWPPCSPRCPR